MIGDGLIGGALILASDVGAQRRQKSQAQLIAQREAKLAKPVFAKANWIFDYDDARAKAESEGKLLFTYFTRSYTP